jgi:hypothetical protein
VHLFRVTQVSAIDLESIRFVSGADQKMIGEISVPDIFWIRGVREAGAISAASAVATVR